MNRLTNPYKANSAGFQLLSGSASVSSTNLFDGVNHQVEDWVKLELTAEQMLQEELMLVSLYVADELSETQKEVQTWEWMAGQWLIKAADPTLIDWQMHGWWSKQATH
jgi:hypothetical protein